MWTREEQFIINRLALVQKPPQSLNRLSLENLNWNSFLEHSRRHGLSGLLYHYCQSPGTKFPAPVLDSLRKEYYHNLIQNTRLLKELDNLLENFEQKRIKVMLLQGVALSLCHIYPSPGLRPITDIDLLIDDENLSLARQALKDSGYRAIPLYPDLFCRKNIVIDLHTSVANLSRISARRYAVNLPNQRLWEQAQRIRGSAYIPDINDLIIIQSAHLQKHSYSRLIWFMDIARLMEKYGADLDWDKIWLRAEEFNLQRPLYFTLRCLKALLNYPLPIALKDNPPGCKLNRLENRLIENLICGNRVEKMGDYLYFASIKQFKQKFLFIKENVFPQKEVMSQVIRHSNPIIIAYGYIIRFWQSLWYGLKLFGSVLNKRPKASLRGSLIAEAISSTRMGIASLRSQ
ncbi:MAG: nucleotidyltransferase family protein [Candidatus Schekmanbacteria bacterium]|nr:nucleotidyltransferase family protein [Candidatus Schekmanbacteria bacterium]